MKPSTLEEEHGPISIGRAPTNRLVLDNPHISSFHGTILGGPEGYRYQDLHSTNGSSIVRQKERIVLGERNRWEEELRNFDRLCLGDIRSPVIIRVELDEAEATQEEVSGTILAARPVEEAPDLEKAFLSDERSLAILYRLGRHFNRLHDVRKPENFLEVITESVFEVFPQATHLALFLRDAPEKEIVPKLAVSRKNRSEGSGKEQVLVSRSLLKEVLSRKEAVLYTDATENAPSETVIRARILSSICVPLIVQDRIIGLLEVDNRETQNVFTEEDLKLLTVYANQVAILLDNARLQAELAQAHEKLYGETQYFRKRQEATNRLEIEGIIGSSPAMQRAFQEIENVAATSTTVLLLGETGVGKEVFAQAIHSMSERRNEAFTAINCTDLTETLLESELFGHRKGAFSEARENKKGLFEISDGGTIFLDEIGDAPKSLQSKLLRVLETGEIRPVGETQTRKVDVRVITATNKDLYKEVQAGNFRQDLYYRLNVFPVEIPPLRERKEDIPALAHHFLQRFAREFKKSATGFHKRTIEHLMRYDYPGNIRELRNIIERIVVRLPVETTIIL
ncbi:MAG: GAF domain-containing protein, partial [Deltaproteobacteria bacterium]